MMTRYLSSAAVIALMANSAAAISVTVNDSASDLTNSLFLNIPGLSVTSSKLSGAFGQSGTYTNESGTFGLPAGIILSSGAVADYGDGPNESDGNSTSFSFGEGGSGDGPDVPIDFPDDSGEFPDGDFPPIVATNLEVDTEFFGSATQAQQDLLFPITGESEHYDVVQLTIEFDAAEDIDSVTFFGSFGSEEFPEFQDGLYTDGFGLYVNGVNVAGVLETGGVAGEDPLLPVNIDHPDMQEIAGTELDGILAPNGNPVLRFDVPINAGGTNIFEVILADASDDIYDTTVYLSSFIPQSGGGMPSNGGGVVVGLGENEFNPILPSNPPDEETGTFIIQIPQVEVDQVFWIDPPVAVGYEYQTDIGLISELVLPSLASVPDLDGYIVSIGGVEKSFAAASTVDLVAEFNLTVGTSVFSVLGIDPDIGLDPADPMAFPLGVSFASITNPTGDINITPVTVDVPDLAPIPLPASGLLLGAGLFGMFAVQRRKTLAG